jgi:hypothetical protein
MNHPYVTAKRVAHLRSTLADRDWQIITTLAKVRVATARQLVRLHLSDVDMRHAQRKLTSLVERRVLARPPRRIGGVGSGSYGHVYVLDAAGQRLADLARGGRPGRPWALGSAFLNHSLAVTEVYVRLVLAERTGVLALRSFTVEPGSWRDFHGPGGGRVTLKPDAYVGLVVDGFTDHWFLEVDLGTEHGPALGRKCSLYRLYWQSGAEEERTGVFPRVLWLVQDQARSGLLQKVIKRQPGEAATLFDVELSSDVVARLRQGAAL